MIVGFRFGVLVVRRMFVSGVVFLDFEVWALILFLVSFFFLIILS